MASSDLAVELPTSRQSRYINGPLPDIYDPNYIPVLDGAELKVDFSQPFFSALPSIPQPHLDAAQSPLKRSKSGSAPETVVHGHGSQALPRRLQTVSKSIPPQELASAHSPTNVLAYDSFSSSGDNTASNSESSAAGVAAVLQEHVLTIPGNATLRVEEMHFPPVPQLARSSTSSTVMKRSHVPTSKFNQKKPSLPSIPPNAVQENFQSPLASRASSSENVQDQPRQETPRPMPLPISKEASPINAQSSPEMEQSLTLRLQATKSTASERRQRALHSHPSNVSLKSRAKSIVEESMETPLTEQPTLSESRPASVRSRSQSICNSQQPTPAPTAPLPDLPPAATRPSIQENPAQRNPTLSPMPDTPSSLTVPTPHLSVHTNQNDHVEMADFMYTRRLTVFRRFDEVHIRLLLHIQGEISTLEREILECEEAGPSRPDKTTRKAGVMKELRKATAEYDHLFANWSAMQANKASDELKEHLSKWLQSADARSGTMPNGAKTDLIWLQDSKDLSAVSLDPEKRLERSQTSLISSKPVQNSESRGGGGGFLALFGCASKRK